MYYEVTSSRVVMDAKGNDRATTENYLVDNAILFAEAETAVLLLHNMENDVVAVKRSNVHSVINNPQDDDSIYLSTIEEVSVDDVGKETKTKTIVAVYAKSIEEATKATKDHISTWINDATLVGVKKSKFVDVVKYNE